MPGTKNRILSVLVKLLLRLGRMLGPHATLEGGKLFANDVDVLNSTLPSVIAAIDIITATSASVTLMLSIVILYFVHSSGTRLAIIGVFTLCSFWRLCTAHDSNTYRDFLFHRCVGIYCRDRQICWSQSH